MKMKQQHLGVTAPFLYGIAVALAAFVLV
jgi:hypothetical protein